MKQLWAPWRMAYIDQAAEAGDAQKAEGCIFCDKPKVDPAQDADQLILHRGKYSFVMMNLYPYNSGHLLIAPYQHVGSLADLGVRYVENMMALTKHCETAIRQALNPDGFNLGANIGRVAGAGFPDHIHLHLVPRWNGDTNFMPVLADVKVMPEFLQQTYAKIKEKLDPLV